MALFVNQLGALKFLVNDLSDEDRATQINILILSIWPQVE